MADCQRNGVKSFVKSAFCYNLLLNKHRYFSVSFFLGRIVYSAAHTAVCLAFQEGTNPGTNAVLYIIPGVFQFESLVSLIVN